MHPIAVVTVHPAQEKDVSTKLKQVFPGILVKRAYPGNLYIIGDYSQKVFVNVCLREKPFRGKIYPVDRESEEWSEELLHYDFRRRRVRIIVREKGRKIPSSIEMLSIKIKELGAIPAVKRPDAILNIHAFPKYFLAGLFPPKYYATIR